MKNIDTKTAKVYSITTFARTNGCLAQLVEQWTENPCVAGSKPAAAGKGFWFFRSLFLFNRMFAAVTVKTDAVGIVAAP